MGPLRGSRVPGFGGLHNDVCGHLRKRGEELGLPSRRAGAPGPGARIWEPLGAAVLLPSWLSWKEVGTGHGTAAYLPPHPQRSRGSGVQHVCTWRAVSPLLPTHPVPSRCPAPGPSRNNEICWSSQVPPTPVFFFREGGEQGC